MSTFTSELPKETILAWRRFLGTDHGQNGVDWLRRNYRRATGETDMQMIRNAAKWEGYQDALDDILQRLTHIPTPDKPLDEEPLERDSGRV